MSLQKFDAKRDYYRVLGVKEDASKDDLDRAYRIEARKRHPDGGGSEEEMKALNEAHDILSDLETRQAYDAERRPTRISYPPSNVFDPDAASRAGTLKIPVSDPDFAGLLMGALACFGLGIPLLLLVEMQWMFFLWPLRIMAFGALTVGLYLSHSALVVKQRKSRKPGQRSWRKMEIIRELIFWLIAAGFIGALFFVLYVAR
ncbi:MAG TPA: DnaJ domain-containing protein [Blastocatellia bacterium]|nr:DnaJ domain-containing protein [Blastocatellia bacterium]